MSNLFIIDGASGTGKSDLVRYVHGGGFDAAVVKKLTTRAKRPNEVDEELDLQFVSQEQFNSAACEYRYLYPSPDAAARLLPGSGDEARPQWYGFSRNSVLEALDSRENVFIIVRNANVISRLLKDFAKFQTISVFVYTDRELIRQRLIESGRSDAEVTFRLARVALDFENYLDNPGLYREVLINSSTVRDYRRLVDNLVGRHHSTGGARKDQGG